MHKFSLTIVKNSSTCITCNIMCFILLSMNFHICCPDCLQVTCSDISSGDTLSVWHFFLRHCPVGRLSLRFFFFIKNKVLLNIRDTYKPIWATYINNESSFTAIKAKKILSQKRCFDVMLELLVKLSLYTSLPECFFFRFAFVIESSNLRNFYHVSLITKTSVFEL